MREFCFSVRPVLIAAAFLAFSSAMQPTMAQTDSFCYNRFKVVDTLLSPNLAIRSDISDQASTIGWLNNNEEVMIQAFDRSGDWASITAKGGRGGWVKASALRGVEGLPRKFNGFLRVKTLDGSYVNLRDSPGMNGELISLIMPGRRVKFQSNQGDWSLVITEAGERGWMNSLFLVCD
jgi:SH3-like domain-containing protein